MSMSNECLGIHVYMPLHAQRAWQNTRWFPKKRAINPLSLRRPGDPWGLYNPGQRRKTLDTEKPRETQCHHGVITQIYLCDISRQTQDKPAIHSHIKFVKSYKKTLLSKIEQSVGTLGSPFHLPYHGSSTPTWMFLKQEAEALPFKKTFSIICTRKPCRHCARHSCVETDRNGSRMTMLQRCQKHHPCISMALYHVFFRAILSKFG